MYYYYYYYEHKNLEYILLDISVTYIVIKYL